MRQIRRTNMTNSILNKKDILIAPSMLAADLSQLGSDIASVSNADVLHVDIMDGHFVPNISFGPNAVHAARECFGGLIDAHLMISNPDELLETFLHAKPDILTFHMEATHHADRLISRIHEAGVFASVALNPATPVSLLEDVLPAVDMVLIMSVNPGFGGQSFIPQALNKIRKLRHMCGLYRACPRVEVDGGIDAVTAKSAVEAGADVLVAGSAVFGHKNRSEAIEALQAEGRKGLSRLV